ncbi:MAG: Fic family protein [Eubacteriales bacterium]|nr:Fic family protein [Eubacteriales bacterium]
MHHFDYSFLDNGVLPTGLLNITADIYSLRAMSYGRGEQFSGIYSALAEIAKIQSVKSSNEIEGIVTTDERIREIVNENSAPLNHSEQEIAGYRDALAEVHTGYKAMDFTKGDIKRLHAIMLNIAGYNFAGQYKSVDNDIIEEDKYGRRWVRFHPVSAAETPEAMKQLTLAYQVARDNPNVNQLLLIPCVILDFLCIHPFRDGNGRISRLLSLMLLYKNEFDAGKYISFEEQINKRKGNYYDALGKSSHGWHENECDYSSFIMEFLTTVYMCYKELDKRFAVVGSKRVTKQTRVEAAVLNSLTPVSKADIVKILPDVSATTVEAVLGRMVKEGAIRKIGSGRGTRYIRN